jgi:RluA family pseudouridine synthase
LYEDRSVLAMDKPRGWMLVPVSWQKTGRNLQAAINSSIAARDFWARSRGLKFLRHVHRLDADTSGVLLFAKSPGAVKRYFDLFESRRMEKTYLAVVVGEPKQNEWTCGLKLAPDPKQIGRMKADVHGKPAETHFKILNKCAAGILPAEKKESSSFCRQDVGSTFYLVECKPITGRTHQIRVHLAESGMPVVGDELYGSEDIKTRCSSRRLPSHSWTKAGEEAQIKCGVRNAECGIKPEPRHLGCYNGNEHLGLRAVRLAYVDPFTKKRVDIRAPTEEFLKEFGF